MWWLTRFAHAAPVAAMLFAAMSTASLALNADSIDEDETVVITAMDGHSIREGAGVVVARNDSSLVIATAAHVVASGQLIVVTDSGAQLPARKVELVPGFDLALVTTSAYPGPGYVATIGSPLLGASIHIWGHRVLHPYVESTGSVVDLDPILPEGPANGRFGIACDGCNHGDSGAGVFDSDGKLLGIVEGARRDVDGNVIFIQCEPIAPLVFAIDPKPPIDIAAR